MKRFILFLVALMGISSGASAQFYDATLLFIEVGKTIENSSSIIYVHFDDDGNMYKESLSKSTARSKYKDGTLEEYGVNKRHDIKRDRSISSSKYYVYSCARHVNTGYGIIAYNFGMPVWGNTTRRDGNNYFGISRSEMVIWNTTSESNEAKNKKFYKAILASDLVPKEVNYDFL